jgi:hypothetical protein
VNAALSPWSEKNTARLVLGRRRIQNILKSYTTANARTLEQKISDAGPSNKRIDPHILTLARQSLVQQDVVVQENKGSIPWYYLSDSNTQLVSDRLGELVPLHRETVKQNRQIGQSLEIAVYRSLASQDTLDYFGHFTDLDAHDDLALYSKEEPPSALSHGSIPDNKKLDFLVHPKGGSTYAGIEVKNIREWFYPAREEVRDFLFKCCSIDVVPVLIARRLHYSTFSVLNPCGVILHQTYNQLYPSSATSLAQSVSNKELLGYHDVRVGNQPDVRLNKFIHVNLPLLLPAARSKFDTFKDLLSAFGSEEMSYKSFAARVKRRVKGEPEDLPEPEPEVIEDPEEPDFY